MELNDEKYDDIDDDNDNEDAEDDDDNKNDAFVSLKGEPSYTSTES